MTLSKDTGIRVSLGLVVAIILYLGSASWKVFGYVATIAANTVAIQNIAKSLELGRLGDEIGDLRKEKRELNRELRKEPDSDILYDQLDEIQDEIEELEHERDCVEDPDKTVCN